MSALIRSLKLQLAMISALTLNLRKGFFTTSYIGILILSAPVHASSELGYGTIASSNSELPHNMRQVQASSTVKTPFFERQRWKHRLLIIKVDASSNTRSQIDSMLERARQDLIERNLKVFLLDCSSEQMLSQKLCTSAYTNDLVSLEDQHAIYARATREGSAILLIGKDGGTKARQQSLNLPALFRIIDAMPMRRMEMKNQPSTYGL